MMNRWLIAASAITLGLVACSKSGGTASAPPANTGTISSVTATAVPTLPPYNVNIDPTKFTSVVTNPYFKLTPGSVRLYVGTKDGVPMTSEFHVLSQTRTLMGVKCITVQDSVKLNGSLEELTLDWFAQDNQGNVWYFGEDTKEYKNGVVTSTAGTWQSGVNGGLPGIAMQASPTTGPQYIEEYLPGVAEDMAQITSTTKSYTVPAGSFQNVVVTENRNPLDPSLIEHKWYAPGVGLIYETKHYAGNHTEVMRLSKVSGI